MAKKKGKIDYTIFSVKSVSFEKGERDPFGFDDFAEKLGAEFLPFSGSVSKPSYFLFVSYVNHLMSRGENKINWVDEKDRNEKKIRLEKLLVYSWKKAAKDSSLRGASIIGNSFNISAIDPFSSKGWVKQNCFRIYTEGENKFKLEKTLHLYLNHRDKEIALLNDFLSKSYTQNKNKEDYL